MQTRGLVPDYCKLPAPAAITTKRNLEPLELEKKVMNTV